MKAMKSEYQSPRVDVMNMIPESGLLQAASGPALQISFDPTQNKTSD